MAYLLGTRHGSGLKVDGLLIWNPTRIWFEGDGLLIRNPTRIWFEIDGLLIRNPTRIWFEGDGLLIWNLTRIWFEIDGLHIIEPDTDLVYNVMAYLFGTDTDLV